MCSLVTSAAPVNYENDETEQNKNKTNSVGTQRKNQTHKNKDTAKKINKEMIEHSYNVSDDDDNSSNLADFKPVQTKLQNKNLYNTNTIPNDYKQNDTPVTSQEAFTQLESAYSKDYYKQYNQQYNQQNNQPNGTNIDNLYQGSYVAPQPSIDSQPELLRKLDNILHLLEEQQEEKTNLITEELILYIFLGVFVIYVLDSFVRVGKYVR